MKNTKIKRIRIEKKIKASELAKKLKISRAAVCYIEQHGITQANTAKRYAAVLQCTPEELIEF